MGYRWGALGGSRRIGWPAYAGLAAAMAVAIYLWGPWAPASVRGTARVIDADTIEVAGTPVELVGIEAPQRSQRCGPRGADTECGAAAAEHLARLVAGKDVTCTPFGSSRYKHMIAICRAGGRDLGEAMVRDGQALAYRRLADYVDYVPAEDEARRANRGMWANARKPAWHWPAGAGKVPAGAGKAPTDAGKVPDGAGKE